MNKRRYDSQSLVSFKLIQVCKHRSKSFCFTPHILSYWNMHDISLLKWQNIYLFSLQCWKLFPHLYHVDNLISIFHLLFQVRLQPGLWIAWQALVEVHTVLFWWEKGPFSPHFEDEVLTCGCATNLFPTYLYIMALRIGFILTLVVLN